MAKLSKNAIGHWWKNLPKIGKIALSVLGVGAVTTAVVVPTVITLNHKLVQLKVETQGDTDLVDVTSFTKLDNGTYQATITLKDGHTIQEVDAITITVGDRILIRNTDYTLDENTGNVVIKANTVSDTDTIIISVKKKDTPEPGPEPTPQTKYQLTLVSDPSNIKTILSGAGEYESESKVLVSATNVEGYDFVGWYDGTKELSKDLSFSYTTVNFAKTLTAKFNAHKPVPTLVGIEISSQPTIKSFKVGETFSSKGLAIKEKYSDGSTSEEITSGFTTNLDNHKFESSDIGQDKEVIVKYKNKTTTYKISVTAATVSTIEITNFPTKLTQYVGDKLDLDGMIVKAIYSDGSVNTNYTNYTAKPSSGTELESAGDLEIILTDNTEPKVTTSTKINVKEDTVSSIEISSSPSTTSFNVGQTFSSDGLKIKQVYQSGKRSEEISEGFTTNYDNHIFTSTDIGEGKEVTVTYNELTISYTIDVCAVAVTSLEVTSCPTKTKQYVGENLDLTGLKVKATYSDGTVENNYTNYTTNPLNGTELETAETLNVIITDNDQSSVFTSTSIEVAERKIVYFNKYECSSKYEYYNLPDKITEGLSDISFDVDNKLGYDTTNKISIWDEDETIQIYNSEFVISKDGSKVTINNSDIDWDNVPSTDIYKIKLADEDKTLYVTTSPELDDYLDVNGISFEEVSYEITAPKIRIDYLCNEQQTIKLTINEYEGECLQTINVTFNKTESEVTQYVDLDISSCWDLFDDTDMVVISVLDE